MLQRFLVLLLVLGLAACSGLSLKNLMPRVDVTGIGIKQLGLFEQHFDVGLRLTNPNDFDLRIEAMDFDLEMNGQPFARGSAQASMLIPATSSIVVRVDAITQSKNLVQQFFSLQPDTLKQGFPYRVRGRVKTDKWFRWLPFEQEGVFRGEEKKPEGIAI